MEITLNDSITAEINNNEISIFVNGQWAGDGVIRNGRIEDCAASLDEAIFAGLEAIIAPISIFTEPSAQQVAYHQQRQEELERRQNARTEIASALDRRYSRGLSMGEGSWKEHHEAQYQAEVTPVLQKLSKAQAMETEEEAILNAYMSL